MTNIILILVLSVILVSAYLYVYNAKKNGNKCVGCPYAKTCNKSCSCNDDK